MCGIAGFNWKDESLVKKMTDTLQHRGPDGEGQYVDKSVSLGHRRLAIIDLSEKGKQPMIYKNYVLTFNGEIYNFEEVKELLLQKGHQFESESDTEVILHAYEEWGVECLEYLNGMWAFCIYDKDNQQLFLSRDRFGIKPLYYYWDKKQFIFASELKAIRKHDLFLDINLEALNFYLYQKYIGKELSIFQQINKLAPSSYLLLDLKNHNLQKGVYYDLKKEIEQQKQMPLADRLDKVEVILKDAVQKRLLADVPVGSFLSGGVDSSLISAIIAQDKKDFNTFSIGFKAKSFDETPFSKIVAKHIGTQHHIQYLEIEEDLIKHVIGTLDEPFGDASVLPTFLLSKITKEKVTVSLSGDAGDEIFGGYDSYKAYQMARFFPNFLLKPMRFLANTLPASDKKLSFTFKVKKFLNDYDTNVQRRHLNWMSQMNEEQRNKLLTKGFLKNQELIEVNNENSLLAIQLNDVHNYLVEDILKKVDIASMLNALEARVPFLDHRLVPLVLSLPDDYKIKGLETKSYLKKISEKYIPKEIIYRKKRGFSVPVAKWIKESSFVKEVLLENDYLGHQLFDKKMIESLYQEHLAGKADFSRLLWLVFVFNYWWKINGTDAKCR